MAHMWRSPNQVAYLDRAYLDGVATHATLAGEPIVVRLDADLGFWRDCNRDDSVQREDYPAQLLFFTDLCPPIPGGGPMPWHNDGWWVSEWAAIAPQGEAPDAHAAVWAYLPPATEPLELAFDEATGRWSTTGAWSWSGAVVFHAVLGPDSHARGEVAPTGGDHDASGRWFVLRDVDAS